MQSAHAALGLNLRTLLVDDEEPARLRLRSLLADFEDLEVVGEAADGEEALRLISDHRPDLVFLDIQMPGLLGTEVISALQPPRPQVIFCTAYDQYAIQAFEHNAVDYLLKPLSRDRLAQAVDRVRTGLRERERARRETAWAAEAQARLLPQSHLPMCTLDYSGSCHPARGVGGDYFDFLSVGQDSLGLVVGDVSGKGLFASLLMASLQARVQASVALWGTDLERSLTEVNRALYASVEPGKYATFFYGIYSDQTRSFRYVNAGHSGVRLLRPHGWQVLDSNGPPLGLFADTRFSSDTLALEPGDLLLLFTDGLPEAVNAAGEELGEEALMEAVETRRHLPADALRDSVLAAVDKFRQGTSPPDDITLVVAKVL